MAMYDYAGGGEDTSLFLRRFGSESRLARFRGLGVSSGSSLGGGLAPKKSSSSSSSAQ